MSDQSTAPSRIIVLIHGIRTDAWWESICRSVLERDSSSFVATIKYGYFDLVRFLCPFMLCRNRPIKRIQDELVGIADKYPDAPIFVIAHSFGTYAIAKILLNNPTIRIHGLILCGCIVPRDFPWGRVASQMKFARNGIVINDCGSLDIWPRMAQVFSWGYGPSGIVGFGSHLVRDRYHQTTHSGFFTEEFIEKYWLPILKDGTIVPTAYEVGGPKTSWLYSVLGFVNKYTIACLIAASAFYLYQDPIGATYLYSLLPYPHACPYIAGTWKTFPAPPEEPLGLHIMQSSECYGNIELYRADHLIGQSDFRYDPKAVWPRTIVYNHFPPEFGYNNILLQCDLNVDFIAETALVVELVDQTWSTSHCSDKGKERPITFVRIDRTLYRESHVR
jgi:pimeloyl-ACP methyl ester carboxylesterase